ncbi:MAG: hypothetical protein RIS94_80 [Pseudomonadota bacterium]|jgi:propanol-preferring alcohol dehydrogenase
MGTGTMLAMVCDGPGKPLRAETRAIPVPGPGEVLVQVLACGVCRTDLHVMDGEIAARYPVVPGHEIVGRVLAIGAGVDGLAVGRRVGVPWLGHACGTCRYCREGAENLCDAPGFTGATRDGGYATHALADARFCFPLPAGIDDVHAAPLLCAGLIGWRAFRMAGLGTRIGLYGFGAAAHLLAQLAVAEGRAIYAFTQPGDASGQAFARSLGCAWAGGSDERPPEELDAAILFAPVGALVPAALKVVRKGGRVVCAGIHMSDIPAFPYADLWGERQIVSVANLTREDGISYLGHARLGCVHAHVTAYPLADANAALADLREGRFEGAAVLLP